MTVSVFDFFSGCGGTSKGFQNAGLTPIYALDFDEDSARTYKENFPNVLVSTSDITRFETNELADLVGQADLALFLWMRSVSAIYKAKHIQA